MLGLSKLNLIIGAAALTVIGGLYIRGEIIAGERDDALQAAAIAEQQRDQVIALNDELRATLEGVRERHARTLSQLQDLDRRNRAVRTATDEIRRETRDAEDGPVADVLSRTLDGLRAQAGSADRDEGGGDPPTNPAATD